MVNDVRRQSGPSATRPAVPLKPSTKRPSSRGPPTSSSTRSVPQPAGRRPSIPSGPMQAVVVRRPSATRRRSNSLGSQSAPRTVVVAAPARRVSQTQTRTPSTTTPTRAAPAAGRPTSAMHSLPSITVHTPQTSTQRAGARLSTHAARPAAPTRPQPNRVVSTTPSAGAAPGSARSTATPSAVAAATRRRSHNTSPTTPFQRGNSFQVVASSGTGSSSVVRDNTPLPTDFFVMHCHRCFRFSCARRAPGQTATTRVTCPTCHHSPVEVPRTRSGLFAMYSRAARKHNADPNSTVALQAMISLHHQTDAPVVLFRGITSPPAPSPTTPGGAATRPPTASRRPFVEDTFTPEEIMFTFEQFPRGLGKWSDGAVDTTCVVCLEECGGCGKPVVKLQGCGHFFHAACVKPWILNKNDTCPMCRAPLIAREPS